MWHIDDAQAMQFFGVLDRQHPTDQPAPIMSNQIDLFIVQCLDQTEDIFHQRVNTVSFNPLRLVTQVITALIWNNNSAAHAYEGRDLFSPPIPKLGKPVQQ
jgi:hypothetical protein